LAIFWVRLCPFGNQDRKGFEKKNRWASGLAHLVSRRQVKVKMIDFLVYRIGPALILAMLLLLMMPQTSTYVIRWVAGWIYGM